MPETIETELEEQPAAPRSSGLEQQLAVMQEQIAALGRQVQRLNGDPDAPVTRADLYAALDELRTSAQPLPTVAPKRQLSDADISAIADAVLDGLDEQLVEEEEPGDKKKTAKPKTATSGKRQADEEESEPRRRGYFPDA
jgi:TolA-binding protein